MKHFLLVSAAVLCLAALTACGAQSPSSPASSSSAAESAAASSSDTGAVYHSATPQQVKEWLDSGSTVTVVDVRTQGEYGSGHLPGAILIPNETISDAPPAQLPDKDAVIVVYCRTGGRSRQAANKLVAIGYTNIYDMGGIQSWPYETVTE